MSRNLIHKFQSTVPDGAQPLQIQPQRDWNDEHVFSGGATGALLAYDATQTDHASWLASVAAGKILRAAGVGVLPAWSTLTIPDTVVAGDLVIASATNVLASLADVAAGSYLRSGGVGAAPLWSTLTLPNTATQGDLVVATGANALGSVADVAVGQVLTSGGVGAVPAWSASPTLTKVLVGNGLVGAPSVALSVDPTTGVYSTGAGILDLALSGARAFSFQAGAALYLLSNTAAIVFGASSDTSLLRGGAAGKVQITGSTPMLQLGGTTASFPAWKAVGTQLVQRFADDSGTPGYGRATAQTGANAAVATYTPTADGTFVVGANVLVTTATTHAFTVTCAYTDEGNTARTLTLAFTLVAGGTLVTSVANANGAVPYMGLAQQIRVKANTAITIATAGTFTTVTYNVEGSIRQAA